jgi:hypothetical protein
VKSTGVSKAISSHAGDDTQRVALTGSVDSRRGTLSRLKTSKYIAFDDEEEDEDLVSWASLLSALHDRQAAQIHQIISRQNFTNNGIPVSLRNLPVAHDALSTMDQRHALVCIKPKTRSWDLMPPDVVRPMASTTLGTLITIAHRMGMVWQDMIPRDGKLRAESAAESLSATLIRGLGLVVEYNTELKEPNIDNNLYVPSFDADKVCYNVSLDYGIQVAKSVKMACGIIPGNHRFHLWDLYHLDDVQASETDSVVAFLNDLRTGEGAIDAIKRSTSHKSTEHHWPAFSDILGLWSDWTPLKSSHVNSVISPIGQRLHTMCEAYEPRVVWRWLLQEQEKMGPISNHRQKVLDSYNLWVQKEPRRFYTNYKLRLPDAANMSFFKQIYDETTAFFEDACQGPSYFYRDLVVAHISTNAHSLEEADERIKAGTSRNDGRVGHNLWDTLCTERAFQYADNLPNVTLYMKQNGHPEDLVEDAWWMLMLRGQCWEMSVNRAVRKSCVPSSYYNSPTKVYIL